MDAINGATVKRLTHDIWKGIKVNIAVIGISGTGKSTFINTLRNLRPGDYGAAKVGVTETTKYPTPYPHPRNESVVFWDLPGIGTKQYPQDKYKALINFSMYHFFLILSCTRFYELDRWIAVEVEKAGKKFFFVRTKVDIDVSNAKRDTCVSEYETLAEILENCKSGLKDMKSKDVFYISCHNPTTYKFDYLRCKLIKEVCGLQKKVLALSLIKWAHFSHFKKERNILQNRIEILTYIYQIFNKRQHGDNIFLAREVNLYRRIFGLDTQNIRTLALRLNLNFKEIQKTLYLKTSPKACSPDDVALTIATVPLCQGKFTRLPKYKVENGTRYLRNIMFLQTSLQEVFDDAYKLHIAYRQLVGQSKL